MYMESVGIIIIAKDTDKMFLLHRSKKPIVWSSLSGKMDEGETPMETIKREIKEEIGLDPGKIKGIKQLGVTKTNHHVMVGFVDTEFVVPDLEVEENDDYGWFSQDEIPSPIHKRWGETFQLIKPYLNLRETIKRQLKRLLK